MYSMRIKKFLAVFLACAIAMGALSLTASADTGYSDDILQDVYYATNNMHF